MRLTSDQFAEFEERGYVTLPGLVADEVTGELLDEARRLMVLGSAMSAPRDPSRIPILHNLLDADPYSAEPVQGRVSWHVQHVFRFSDAFLQTASDPAILAAVEGVLGPELWLLDDQLYVKPAGSGGATYLHRDGDFFGALPMVTAWVALTDADEENGCLWMVPGSHRAAMATPGIVKKTRAGQGVGGGRTCPIDYLYEIADGRPGMVPAPVQRGGVLLIHRDVLHCGFENRSGRDRVSYVLEYFDGAQLTQYREVYSGMFEYHDRIHYAHNLRGGDRKVSYSRVGNTRQA